MKSATVIALFVFSFPLVGCEQESPPEDRDAQASVSVTGDDDINPEGSEPTARAKTAPDFADTAPEAQEGSAVIAVDVQGMFCAGCATSVYDHLVEIDGVRKVRVSVKNHTAWVVADADAKPEGDLLVQAVKDAGYEGALKN